MTAIIVITALSAMLLPLVAAVTLWRNGDRDGPGFSTIVILESAVAATAAIAIGCQLLTGLGASVWTTYLEVLPGGWFVVAFAIVMGAVLRMTSAELFSERRAVSILLAGQAAANVLALANDLRIIVISIACAAIAPVFAFATAAEENDRPAITAFRREAGRSCAAAIACGVTLVLAGNALLTFADAAIRARSSGQPTALRFDWSAIRESLARAVETGGSGRAIADQHIPWVTATLVVGFVMLVGCVPFHRSRAAIVRLASPTLRPLLILFIVPAAWLGCGRIMAPLAGDGALTMTLALMTQWLGSILILARGDMPRLTAAALLAATGQVAATVLLPAPSAANPAWLLINGLVMPLGLLSLLLGWLERTYGSHEFNDYHGLARALPRFSVALTVAVLWLCGAPGLSVFPGLWAAWLRRTPFAGLDLTSLWLVLIPQIIAIWGWLRLLDGLLLGTPRLPQMPEILEDRVEILAPGRPPGRDLERSELIVIAMLATTGVLLEAGALSGALPHAAPSPAAVDPRSQDDL